VAHAPADGYTLLNASMGNLAIAPQRVQVLRKAFDEVLAEPETIAELQKPGLAPQRLSIEQSEAVIRSTYGIARGLSRRRRSRRVVEVGRCLSLLKRVGANGI
jgi:hypothetical protein